MAMIATEEREPLIYPTSLDNGTLETILVVEDDIGVRTVICRALGRLGYKVIQAEGGQEAIGIIREVSEKIDLLLTDIMMPGMNGLEVAAETERSRPGIPIFFMSGYADQELVSRGLLDPSTHFLQKPFSPQELGKRVREVLDQG